MADNDTQQDYFNNIRAIANELIDRCRAGEIEDLSDAIHEEVDGSWWVIYTYAARKVLEYSDNDEAGPDAMGWDEFASGAKGWGDLYSRGAYYAMEADINDELSSRDDFDPNDPDSWTETDDEG